MTFGEWVRRRLLGLPERRFDAPLKPIDQMFADMRRGSSTRVGREEALSVPAVLRGRNLICSIGSLPLVQRAPDLTREPSALLAQIDDRVANVVTVSQTVEDLVFEGIAWWRVTARGFDGFPRSAARVDPGKVSLDPPIGRGLQVLPSGNEPAGPGVYIDGKFVLAADIIRFDSPNPPVLKVAGRAIRRAILLDQAARLYASDPRPLDYFRPAENADELPDEEIEETLAQWDASRRRRATAYIPRALEYASVQAPTAADMQLVELQARAALEIANAFGVDPEDLGVSTTSRTYANVNDRRRDRINDVLSPFMRAITDRLSMPDVTRRGYTVEFDLDDYMKSNPTERWTVYNLAHQIGALSPEEIRQIERIPGPAPDAAPPADVTPIAAGRRRTAASFTAAAGLSFMDIPVSTFSVDTAKRTIEGVALPYGRTAEQGGLKWRFRRGALKFSDVSRVKLLRDHDYGQPLGRAVELRDGPNGFRARFTVAPGAEGDRALELADHGVLDGLSVGVDFDMARDTVPDPDEEGVILVRRATLREVSLTAMPAFDDARVTRVTASRQGGAMHTCGTCGAELEPGVAHTCPTPAPAAATFSADQVGAMIARLFPTVQPPPTPAAVPAGPDPADVPAGPAVVDPTGPGTTGVTLNEPAPYRFDRKGNLRSGSHDFSRDLYAMSTGDNAAGDRAMEFIRQQFDVVTTDVNELNPTRNRPELYVDQREYRYPVWEAINKGTLNDITPFTFPKFSSASGLVGNHTEGTEPSSGTYVTTSQTVTPTAVSGKAKISRETWDQGGNPQVSNLIWQQMVRGWYEALEAAAVAVLDAASPTQIDFSATPGLSDDDLDQALTAALAGLQFVRGGFSMDAAFAQIDFYKALIAATDADGRRLYPAIGPANAMGTVDRRFGAVDVNGVQFLPAWALAATGTVAASSYLFDRAVVHGWASAPQRLDFQIEVANVYIGLWGYKATAISDISGVREIVYDPA